MKILIDTINVKLKSKQQKKKRENVGINRRKNMLIKKTFELGEFDDIDEALITTSIADILRTSLKIMYHSNRRSQR